MDVTRRSSGAGQVVAEAAGGGAGVAVLSGATGVFGVGVHHASVDVSERHPVGPDLLQHLRRDVAPVAAPGGVTRLTPTGK